MEFELEIYTPDGDILAVGIERHETEYKGTDDYAPYSMVEGFKVLYYMLGDGVKFHKQPDWLDIADIESLIYEF